jgi:hypothetical protein
MKSTYLTINIADLLKGAMVAAGTVVLSLIGGMVQSGTTPTEADLILSVKAGGIAAISYLVKNLFTNSNDQIFKSESN